MFGMSEVMSGILSIDHREEHHRFRQDLVQKNCLTLTREEIAVGLSLTHSQQRCSVRYLHRRFEPVNGALDALTGDVDSGPADATKSLGRSFLFHIWNRTKRYDGQQSLAPLSVRGSPVGFRVMAESMKQSLTCYEL